MLLHKYSHSRWYDGGGLYNVDHNYDNMVIVRDCSGVILSWHDSDSNDSDKK